MKAGMVITALFVGSTAFAAAPQPTTQSAMVVSDAELQAKLDALNKKRATTAPSPTSVPAAYAAELAARRQALIRDKQMQLDFAAMSAAEAADALRQAEQLLPTVDQQLAQVQAAGRAAEFQWSQLVAAKEAALAEARRPQHSTIRGTQGGSYHDNRGGYGTYSGSINGTVTTDASPAALAAISAQYDTPIVNSQAQVVQLANQQNILLRNRASLIRAIEGSRAQIARMARVVAPAAQQIIITTAAAQAAATQPVAPTARPAAVSP